MVGIGGTGVVTVDQLLVTAALLEGKYALHLDQTGLAQKGGPVLSNLILSESPILRANRIAAGQTDTLLSFDFLASVSHDNLAKYHPERTRAVVNTTHNGNRRSGHGHPRQVPDRHGPAWAARALSQTGHETSLRGFGAAQRRTFRQQSGRKRFHRGCGPIRPD